MKWLNKAALALATAGVLSSGVAQAALFDRGGGLIYDDVLNVTWLSDANYGAGSTYDDNENGGGTIIDGRMTWANANAWAANLSFTSGVNVFDNWRLPTVVDTGTPNCNGAYSGTDCGWNVQTVSGGTVYSELAYMYYINLGNQAAYNISGIPQSGYGLVNDPVNPNDESLFSNLKSAVYWTGTEFVAPTIYALGFDTSNGYQYNYDKNSDFYAWAVHTGDVGAVPEPGTYAMLMAGLGLLGAVARRRKPKQK